MIDSWTELYFLTDPSLNLPPLTAHHLRHLLHWTWCADTEFMAICAHARKVDPTPYFPLPLFCQSALQKQSRLASTLARVALWYHRSRMWLISSLHISYFYIKIYSSHIGRIDCVKGGWYLVNHQVKLSYRYHFINSSLRARKILLSKNHSATLILAWLQSQNSR